MLFDWDDGNVDKCRKHGVSVSEIEEIAAKGRVINDERHSAVEDRFLAFGVTRAGRDVAVVFTWREGKVRPISARYMHRHEVVKHERP